MIKLPLSTSKQSALAVATNVARRAGKVALERFNKEKKVSFKGRANVVTDVDIKAETAVLTVLKKEYPDFNILSEESEPIKTSSSYSWIVDPVDGTRNYASNVPHYCVVVALALEGEIILGITYDPVRDELFHAEKGKGAHLNGTRISVSPKKTLEQCLLGFDMGYVDKKALTALSMVQGLWGNLQGMRVMGSSALGLAYAACGRFDLYFHHHLYPWDIASGLLLVNEAGGVVLDKKGEISNLQSVSVIASSHHLLDLFLKATNRTEWRLST